MNTTYKTILVIVAGCLLLNIAGHIDWMLYVAIVVAVAALASARLAGLIVQAWLKLSSLLAMIMPNVILSIVFFLVLLPLSLLSRIISKQDSLLLAGKPGSTFQTVNKEISPADFEKPW